MVGCGSRPPQLPEHGSPVSWPLARVASWSLFFAQVVPFLPSRPPKKKPNQLPTLQAFEHDLKKFVDFGMFFFTLANAGVQLKYVGALTWSVLVALIFGKIIGVSIFVLSMDKVKCAPLHRSIKSADVAMVGSMASIGLTVALFVSGEAFADPRLQGESKLGALLSGLMGLFCLGIAKSPLWRMCARHRPRPVERVAHGASAWSGHAHE